MKISEFIAMSVVITIIFVIFLLVSWKDIKRIYYPDLHYNNEITFELENEITNPCQKMISSY